MASFQLVSCSNLNCPRFHNDELYPLFSSEQAVVDTSGHVWCPACAYRATLLAWGKVHHWPMLTTDRYAVAEGLGFWTTAALLGTDEYVCALLAATEAYDRRAA